MTNFAQTAAVTDAVEAVRDAWSKPSVKAVAVEDRTEGAFIPGPAEIPSLCS